MKSLWVMLGRDFWPQHNRRVPWRHPLGIAAGIVVAAFLCANLASAAGLPAAIAMLAATVVGIVWPFASVTGMHGTLRYNRLRSREGEAVIARVQLVNRWPLPVFGLGVEAGWHRASPKDQSSPWDLHLVYLGPWGRGEAAREFRPPRRGVYSLAPPKVRCGFPFGLWHASRRLQVARELIVWPARVPVRALPDGGGQAFHTEHFQDKVGTCGETIGVREYRRGDALVRIHWRQTAKHRRLIVRERQSPTSPCVQIILDLRSSVHAVGEQDCTRESAIRLAGSFAESAYSRGTGVEIVVAGIRVAGTRELLLDMLARLPDDATHSLAELAVTAGVGGENRSQIVITSDVGFAEPGAAASFGPNAHCVVLETSLLEDSCGKRILGLPRPWWTIRRREASHVTG